jgi:hypothetical protein
VRDFIMAGSSAPASAPTMAGRRRQQINADGPRTLLAGSPFAPRAAAPDGGPVA